jgi:hypothetical protein
LPPVFTKNWLEPPLLGNWNAPDGLTVTATVHGLAKLLVETSKIAANRAAVVIFRI